MIDEEIALVDAATADVDRMVEQAMLQQDAGGERERD
jgi:hypothetical protein